MADREFADDKTKTIDEVELYAKWTSILCPQLRQAMIEWDQSAGVPVATEVRSIPQAMMAKDPMDTAAGASASAEEPASGSPSPRVAVRQDWKARMAERAKRLAVQQKPNLCSLHYQSDPASISRI